MRHGLIGMAALALTACGEGTSSVPEGPLPGRGTEIGRLVGPTTRAFYCGDTGFVDVGSAVDGPAYYFRRSDGAVIGTCGGACMMDKDKSCDRDCPPKSWTCGALPDEAYAPFNQRR